MIRKKDEKQLVWIAHGEGVGVSGRVCLLELFGLVGAMVAQRTGPHKVTKLS